MLKYIIFIFCIFFSYPSLIAQQVVIQGRVKDTTNKPIVGASVILRANDSNGIIKYYKITDENGIFKITISNINQQLFFQISSVGFVTYSEHLTNPLISLNKIFTLQSYLGNLPEVFIKDNPDIIKKNDTTTYMVAAFERGNENNIGDLLKNLPGIIVTDNGKVIFNGKMIDRVLIEDDDIFGNNYAALIKNVSTNGLDKIDIIEHYNDRSKIENSKKEKGNETVLNLRYKKKKLRLFSSINSAGGYSIENYEVKADIVSLIPNAKFVSTTNMNSLGTTGSYLLGRENNLNLFENYNEEPITKVATVSNPVNFHDITPNNISTSRTLFNTSKFITINSQLKVSKKIMVKESVSIIADDYTQSKKTIEVFNNPLQPLVIEEDEKLEKNNKQFYVGLEASWLPNAKFQSVLKYNISSINATHQNNGFLFQSPFFQNLYQKAKNHQLTLKNTKLITGRKLITSQILYSNYQLKSQYRIQPPLYDTSFRDTNNYQNLYQPYDAEATTLAGMIRFYSGKYRKSFALQLTGVQDKYKINSEVFLYNKENNLQPLPSTYTNNTIYNLTKITFSSGMNIVFNDKMKTAFEIALQWSGLRNEQQVFNNIITDNKLQLLPSFNFEYRINNDKSLYLYFQTQPIFPQVYSLGKSYVFTGLNSIVKGSNDLKISRGFTSSISYHYFGSVTKKSIFTVYLSVSNNAINYLQNLTNRGLYSFTSFEIANEKNLFTNCFIKAEQKIAESKSWLIFTTNVSMYKTYSLVNYQKNTNYGNSIKTELRWKTDWKKWFNINTGIIYSYQTLNTFSKSIKINTFSSKVLTSNTVIGFKFFKKINADILVDYLLNKSDNKEVKQIIFTDAQIIYNVSKRLKFGVIAKNFLNQKEFMLNQFNSLQNTISYFDLQPAFYLLTFGIKL